jgi:hypothetical protein
MKGQVENRRVTTDEEPSSPKISEHAQAERKGMALQVVSDKPTCILVEEIKKTKTDRKEISLI